MKVAVLGGSGFVGSRLVPALRARGDEVVLASLRDPQAAAAAAAGCDAIVNLAGEPVAQRWNPAVKRAIVDTRTVLPQRFFEALSQRDRAVRAYVSASGVGYYGTSETQTFDEASPAGRDFLATTCESWEATARSGGAKLGVRVAIVRIGIALGTEGGALAKLLPPFRMGMGGIVGNGRQWLSWVHVDDVAGIFMAALDRGEGVYNATAPNPVTNAEFARTLGEALGRPAVVPTPTFALRLMLGEAADVVLTGQRVLPHRTQNDLHYTFAHTNLNEALHNLLA